VVVGWAKERMRRAKHDFREDLMGTLRFATSYLWVCWERGGCLNLVVGCDLELPTLKKGDRGGFALEVDHSGQLLRLF